MTINNHLLGFDLIDPIWLQVDGVKKLEVFNADSLITTYQFNEYGKVESRKGSISKGGWKAYPPLSKTDKTNINEPINKAKKEEFLDKYIYSPLGNLMKIETHNLTTGKITLIKHLSYENNKIVSIISNERKTYITRDNEGRIVAVKFSADVANIFTQSYEFILIKNLNQKIIGRKIIFNNNNLDLVFTYQENFDHNANDQIISSESNEELDGENFHMRTEFEYLNKNSTLITSIKQYKNGKSESTFKYFYDQDERITKHTIQQENLNKDELYTTKYIWT